jgi:hypothetical protein
MGISINAAMPSHMPYVKFCVPSILATSPLKMRNTSPSRYVISISAPYTTDRIILVSSMMCSFMSPP